MTDIFFIFGAKYVYLISVAAFGIYFLFADREKKKKLIIFSLIAFALSFLMAVAGRQIYDNPRPFVVEEFTPLIPHSPDNGFPSDHTLLASAIASVILFFNIHLGIWLWLMAGIVGLSRVYVGVHHFIDVIASALMALISALAAYAIIHQLWKTKTKNL
jgi:undecaprenyl-diphosphatase